MWVHAVCCSLIGRTPTHPVCSESECKCVLTPLPSKYKGVIIIPSSGGFTESTWVWDGEKKQKTAPQVDSSKRQTYCEVYVMFYTQNNWRDVRGKKNLTMISSDLSKKTMLSFKSFCSTLLMSVSPLLWSRLQNIQQLLNSKYSWSPEDEC